jgi:hypothetical protein
MTYQEWEARGHEAGNAEAATAVMGWHWDQLKLCWLDASALFLTASHAAYGLDWSPCTDRNATDIVLAEVERLGSALVIKFGKLVERELGMFGFDLTHEVRYTFGMRFSRAPASLLTWAACEACKKKGA